MKIDIIGVPVYLSFYNRPETFKHVFNIKTNKDFQFFYHAILLEGKRWMILKKQINEKRLQN